MHTETWASCDYRSHPTPRGAGPLIIMMNMTPISAKSSESHLPRHGAPWRVCGMTQKEARRAGWPAAPSRRRRSSLGQEGRCLTPIPAVAKTFSQGKAVAPGSNRRCSARYRQLTEGRLASGVPNLAGRPMPETWPVVWPYGTSFGRRKAARLLDFSRINTYLPRRPCRRRRGLSSSRGFRRRGRRSPAAGRRCWPRSEGRCAPPSWAR